MANEMELKYGCNPNQKPSRIFMKDGSELPGHPVMNMGRGIEIASGSLGMGLGVGVSKYDYLPEAHTDFAFAIFCQENGFIGAVFVFLLYAALAVYSARVANKAEDSYGQILAMGILILIVGQAIANLLMVGGAFPVVGVPLPFISYGGTSLLVSLTAMAILVNIGRRGDLARQKRNRE